MFVISSGMSGTFQNANIAASELDNVFVIDTKNLSTGGGLLVVAAAEMAAKGMEAPKIVEEIEKNNPFPTKTTKKRKEENKSN